MAFEIMTNKVSFNPSTRIRKSLRYNNITKLNRFTFFWQNVTLWKKVHVIYSFFVVRKLVAHIVTFIFYCVILPATVLVPEVTVPKWGAVYIPSVITLLNAVGTPR